MTFFSRQQWNTWESVFWILSAIPAEPILGYKYSSDKGTNIRCRELFDCCDGEWEGETPGYLAISFTQSWIKCVTSKRRGANIVISWVNRPLDCLDLTSWKWYISSYSICFSSCVEIALCSWLICQFISHLCTAAIKLNFFHQKIAYQWSKLRVLYTLDLWS